jgi:hypothetical protein
MKQEKENEREKGGFYRKLGSDVTYWGQPSSHAQSSGPPFLLLYSLYLSLPTEFSYLSLSLFLSFVFVFLIFFFINLICPFFFIDSVLNK